MAARKNKPIGFDDRDQVAYLEVHEHVFITGRRSNGVFVRATQKTTSQFSHSHEGGDVPHQHPDTGPACYTIDKDAWLAATGLRGGGRKNFTKAPTGEQLDLVELEERQRSFDVIVGDPPPGFEGEGAGVAPAARMVLAFGLRANVRSARWRS